MCKFAEALVANHCIVFMFEIEYKHNVCAYLVYYTSYVVYTILL